MTIKPITSYKAQVAKHVASAKRHMAQAAEDHITACEDLAHIVALGKDGKPTGDVSLCQDFYTKLGGKISPARTATLKAWFVEMSGNQITADKNGWKMKRGWDASKFKLEEAEKTPYWSREGERNPVNLSIAGIVKMIHGLNKKIDKAVSEDRFNGDPDKAKALVSNVINIADAQFKKLTPAETGELEAGADAILSGGNVPDNKSQRPKRNAA